MEVEIFYCKTWTYLSRAFRVGEEIREGFPQANIQLIKTSGGEFRVVVDGVTIYDKNETQAFPKIFEVTKIIKDMN